MDGEEFSFLRRSKGLTQQSLADLIGVSKRQIANLESGITPVKDIYVEILSAYTHPSINQTATGNGIVQVGHGSSNNDISGYGQPRKQDSHLLQIPYYSDIRSSAGFGAINGRVEEPEMFTLPKHLLPSASKETEAIRCAGDSMSPSLQDGDIMFVDRANTDLHDGEIYVIRVEDELYVKRLVRVPGKIIAKSDNNSYPDFELSGDNFEILGRVIYRMERV